MEPSNVSESDMEVEISMDLGLFILQEDGVGGGVVVGGGSEAEPPQKTRFRYRIEKLELTTMREPSDVLWMIMMIEDYSGAEQCDIYQMYQRSISHYR